MTDSATTAPRILVIGLAGGSGSGKTSIALELVRKFGEDRIALIKHDSYYRDLSTLPIEERAKTNFDHPDSLETELLIEHVQQLKAGNNVEVPQYDFTKHARCHASKNRIVEPKCVVVLEGILLFENKELRDLIDVKIFIDTQPDIRFIRRLKRDVAERGRTMQDVTEQYLNTVRPMHEEFVEPKKKCADLIIPEGGYHSHVAIDLIAATIEARLQSVNGVEQVARMPLTYGIIDDH